MKIRSSTCSKMLAPIRRHLVSLGYDPGCQNLFELLNESELDSRTRYIFQQAKWAVRHLNSNQFEWGYSGTSIYPANRKGNVLEEIVVGDSLSEKIETALEECDYVIVALSKKSIESTGGSVIEKPFWCIEFTLYAIDENKSSNCCR